MIIKIDVDGVIRDIITAMCDIYNERFNCDLNPTDVTDYDINLNFPKIYRQTGKQPTEYFFKDNAELIFNTVSRPFDGVKEAIDSLRNNGHKVVIVTWQFNLENIKHTLEFLDRYSIQYDDICFTHDKWMIKGDYLIDDNPAFIMDKRDSSKKIVIDTPYNRNIPEIHKRCTSLESATQYILDKQKSKVA